MSKATGTWTCSNGLELSVNLGQKLEATYQSAFRAGRAESAMTIGVWYCPACGIPLDGQMSCGECGKSLLPFLRELVELHPHPDGKGGWR
jgi:hypothetical protein